MTEGPYQLPIWQNVQFLSPPIALCIMGVEAAIECHLKNHNVLPTTLLVSATNLITAYKVVRELETKFMIVPIPGLAREDWGLIGEKGMVWSLAT